MVEEVVEKLSRNAQRNVIKIMLSVLIIKMYLNFAVARK